MCNVVFNFLCSCGACWIYSKTRKENDPQYRCGIDAAVGTNTASTFCNHQNTLAVFVPTVYLVFDRILFGLKAYQRDYLPKRNMNLFSKNKCCFLLGLVSRFSCLLGWVEIILGKVLFDTATNRRALIETKSHLSTRNACSFRDLRLALTFSFRFYYSLDAWKGDRLLKRIALSVHAMLVHMQGIQSQHARSLATKRACDDVEVYGKIMKKAKLSWRSQWLQIFRRMSVWTCSVTGGSRRLPPGDQRPGLLFSSFQTWDFRIEPRDCRDQD